MNETLQKFYNAYAAWLDAGAPQGQPFSRGYGLCDNLYYLGYHRTLRELKCHFESEGYATTFPFGGSEVFDTETVDFTMHLNPLRVQWVKHHAK